MSMIISTWRIKERKQEYFYRSNAGQQKIVATQTSTQLGWGCFLEKGIEILSLKVYVYLLQWTFIIL